MLLRLSLLSLALAGAAQALSTGLRPRQSDGAANTTQTLLIGGGPSGTIATAVFDGVTFSIVANDTRPGTSASWLLFKEPNLLYAVDENSNTTRLFNVGNPLFLQAAESES